MKSLFPYLISSLICVNMLWSLAQNPKLDATFYDKGWVSLAAGQAYVEVENMVLQADGAFVLGGNGRKIEKEKYVPPSQSITLGIMITRLLPGGRIDSSFANEGFFFNNFHYQDERLNHIALDSLGRMYAAITGYVGGFPDAHFIIRLQPDGKLDSTFASQGTYIFPNNLKTESLNKILIAPGIRVIVCGKFDSHFQMLALTANGSLDTTFGTGGKQIVSIEGDPDIALQHDSLLLVGGHVGGLGALHRYLPDGRTDTTFGTHGMALLSSSLHPSTITHLDILPDQSIWACGSFRNNFFVSALLPNGSIDSSKLIAGDVRLPFFAMEAEAMAVNANHEVYILQRNPVFFSVIKLDSSGQMDSLFGFQGEKRFRLENLNSIAKALHLDQHGDIWIGGFLPSYVALCKLRANGSFAPEFNSIGYDLYALEDGGSYFGNAEIDQRNNLYFAGASYLHKMLNGQSIIEIGQGLLTYKVPNDDSLQHHSHFQLPIDEIHELHASRDSGLLLLGTELDPSLPQRFNVSRLVVLKLDKNGDLDTSFGTNGRIHMRDRFQGSGILEYSDGKICFVAQAGTFGVLESNRLTMLKRNGSVYRLFGSYGSIDDGAYTDPHEPTSIAIAKDQQLLYSGRSQAENKLFIRKFNDRGHIDKRFGLGGWVKYDLSSPMSRFVKMLRRDNGKILVTAIEGNYTIMVQFQADGSVDTDFAYSGKQRLSHSDFDLIASCMEINLNGETLVAGRALPLDSTSAERLFVACISASGQLKSDFGDGGYFFLDLPSLSNRSHDIVIESNGNFYLVGTSAGKALIIHILYDLTLSNLDQFATSTTNQPLVYPNPVSSSTHMRYELFAPQEISINLLDLSGRQLKELVAGYRSAGTQNESLILPDKLPSGWFLLELKTQKKSTFIKLYKR